MEPSPWQLQVKKQTPGPIATVWSRWKKSACRTVLRTAMVSTRAYPKNWSSRRNYGQEV